MLQPILPLTPYVFTLSFPFYPETLIQMRAHPCPVRHHVVRPSASDVRKKSGFNVYPDDGFGSLFIICLASAMFI